MENVCALALTADDSATDGVLLLPYECAEFALLGADLDPLFNELSACNPALLQADRWLATRFAHAEVGLRLITVPQPHLRVVCSPADARFLFELLSTLVAEHGGLTTTLDAYIRLIGVMTVIARSELRHDHKNFNRPRGITQLCLGNHRSLISSLKPCPANLAKWVSISAQLFVAARRQQHLTIQDGLGTRRR